MPKQKDDPLDKVFIALSDKTRRELIHRLTKSELTMSELTKDLDMSLAAASKHVKLLERAGLIRRRIEGRVHYISLVTEPLGMALDWISIYRKFWQDRINALANIVNKEQ